MTWGGGSGIAGIVGDEVEKVMVDVVEIGAVLVSVYQSSSGDLWERAVAAWEATNLVVEWVVIVGKDLPEGSSGSMSKSWIASVVVCFRVGAVPL